MSAKSDRTITQVRTPLDQCQCNVGARWWRSTGESVWMGLTRSTKLRKSLKEQKQVHAGSGHAAVLFRYSPDRKGEHAREHLCGFSGVLQAIITGVVIHVSLQPGNGALNELLKTAHETDWANLASGVLRQGSGANRRSDPAVCQRSRNAGSPCHDIMLTNSMLERFSLT